MHSDITVLIWGGMGIDKRHPALRTLTQEIIVNNTFISHLIMCLSIPIPLSSYHDFNSMIYTWSFPWIVSAQHSILGGLPLTHPILQKMIFCQWYKLNFPFSPHLAKFEWSFIHTHTVLSFIISHTTSLIDRCLKLSRLHIWCVVVVAPMKAQMFEDGKKQEARISLCRGESLDAK